MSKCLIFRYQINTPPATQKRACIWNFSESFDAVEQNIIDNQLPYEGEGTVLINTLPFRRVPYTQHTSRRSRHHTTTCTTHAQQNACVVFKPKFIALIFLDRLEDASVAGIANYGTIAVIPLAYNQRGVTSTGRTYVQFTCELLVDMVSCSTPTKHVCFQAMSLTGQASFYDTLSSWNSICKNITSQRNCTPGECSSLSQLNFAMLQNEYTRGSQHILGLI